MRPNPMLKQLSYWTKLKFLSEIDLGFAEFLDRLQPNEDPTVLLAAALTSQQYGRGHTCMDPAAFLEDPLSFLGRKIKKETPPEIREGEENIKTFAETLSPETWIQTLQRSNVIGNAKSGLPLVWDGDRLYLTRNWRNEQSIAQAIQSRLVDLDTAPFKETAFLQALFGTPSADRPGPNMQKVACALSTRARFLILTGGPGTGKTYTVVRILALLLHQQENLRILLAAPTGKAAARLTESITQSLNADEIKALPESLRAGIPSKATTLHQMLRPKKNSRSFHHNEEDPLHADVVIVDEASMIDLEMMAALIKAVPPKARLILVGDKDQLSSVEAGYVMGDFCTNASGRGYSPATLDWIQSASGEVISYTHPLETDALAQQTVMLTHSERFRGDSGIGQLAEAVNQGATDRAIAILEQTPPLEDIAWIRKDRPDPHLIDTLCVGESPVKAASLAEGYRHYLSRMKASKSVPTDEAEQEAYFHSVLEAFGTFQVLCAVREGPWGVDKLNEMIQAQLEKKGLIRTFGLTHPEWFKGRPIMATRNDYELGIMNGDVGITLDFREEGSARSSLRVVFRNPDSSQSPFKVILPSRLTDVETVFAMTVHKSQGSEFGHVALMIPDPEFSPVLTRELLYTGITRAKKRLTLVGRDKDQLKLIIERQTQRSSHLGLLLTQKEIEQKATQPIRWL